MKKNIRKTMMAKRSQIVPFEKAQRDLMIVHKIINDPRFIDAKIVGIFNAFGSEIDLSYLKQLNKQFAYPKISNNRMNFHIIDSNTVYSKSNYGIMEPVNGDIVNAKIDYLIVPLLAFNEDKHRIGYGKGYYDAFIHQYRPKHKIGVAYAFQKTAFKADIYDEPLDDVFTDEEFD